jgi:hypothetical protein
MTSSMTTKLAAAALALGLFACKDGATELRKSCDTRAGWKKAVSRNCTQCLAKASIPKCNVKCTDKEYSGKCDDESEAARKEPTCEGVDWCLHACQREADGDCACEEKCYEGKPRCKELTGVADACVTSVCDAWCK